MPHASHTGLVDINQHAKRIWHLDIITLKHLINN